MATKYSMEVCDAETGEYTPVALFADFVPADVLHDLCVTLLEDIEGASTVVVLDMGTGEVVAEAAEPDDDPSDIEWDDHYYDMGFDPYMGCYTDDC